jgi:two-component system KDP operon response regulator KdpE
MMSLQKSSVLLVDDESALRTVLKNSLAASGFVVAESASGEDALRSVQRNAFDLILLDINMSGMNGIEACRQIRAISPHAGIVMVTVRDLEDDKVRALEAGADDYVTKPFKLRELLARLFAILRRTRVQQTAELQWLHAGDLKIHLDHRLLWKGEEEIHLSPTEFDLLAFMMKNMGAPLTHMKLLRTIWGPEYGNESEYLRTYVRMLRKKIEKDPAKPEYILTEPWVGYRFHNPSDPNSPSVQADDD